MSDMITERDELQWRVAEKTQECELAPHLLGTLQDAGMANAIQRLFDEPSERVGKKEGTRAEKRRENGVE